MKDSNNAAKLVLYGNGKYALLIPVWYQQLEEAFGERRPP